MKKICVFAALLAVTLLARPASAAVTFGDSWDITDHDDLPGEALQNVLNSITRELDLTTSDPTDYRQVNSTVNVVDNQLATDRYWQISGGTGGSLATIVIEVAGNLNSNTFGIFDITDSGKRVQIFSGAAGAGARQTVSITDDGSVLVGLDPDGENPMYGDSGTDFAGNLFGYYLSGPGGLFFSDESLNLNSVDYMAAYQGVGDVVKVGVTKPGPWGANEYLLAWEDLPYTVPGSTDMDCNDFVVIVESVSPVAVPEPASTLVWGFLGAVGFCWLRRRRKA